MEAAGDSDHLAVLLKKFSREIKIKPQSIKKRKYKNFDIESFLKDVRDSNIESVVTSIQSIDQAAQVFQDMFTFLLDRYAPVKVFHIRKHYVPYLSEETKLLMEERDSLKLEATKKKDPVLHHEFKLKRN